MHNIMTGGITFNVGYNPGNKYAYDCEGNDIAWQTGKTWVVTSNTISWYLLIQYNCSQLYCICTIRYCFILCF